MRPMLIGLLVGAVLAWATLTHGLGGLLIMAVFLLLGGFIGRMMENRIDLHALRDALTGRRSSS